MQKHTIIEDLDCWIIDSKIIVNKQPKPTKFKHWFEDFIYDVKRNAEK